MDQAGIIRDLLTWLEGHLDQPRRLTMWRQKQVIPSGTCKECLRT